MKNCLANKFWKATTPIRFNLLLIYLCLLLMFWADIFMFYSIRRQFSMFEFWWISWPVAPLILFFSGKCQVLTIPLCQNIPYNMTVFPNHFRHKTQEEAGLEVHQFYPLVLTNCSSYLTLFLCSLYAPICTILNRPPLPCRGLCNRVKDGCLPLLQKFGFSWPESMACEKFPKRNGPGICVDMANIAAVTTQPPRPTDGKISGTRCIRYVNVKLESRLTAALFPPHFS